MKRKIQWEEIVIAVFILIIAFSTKSTITTSVALVIYLTLRDEFEYLNHGSLNILSSPINHKLIKIEKKLGVEGATEDERIADKSIDTDYIFSGRTWVKKIEYFGVGLSIIIKLLS